MDAHQFFLGQPEGVEVVSGDSFFSQETAVSGSSEKDGHHRAAWIVLGGIFLDRPKKIGIQGLRGKGLALRNDLHLDLAPQSSSNLF